MKQNTNSSRFSLILAMCIFGTVGIFRRSIELPSSMIALVRGVIGTSFLILYLLVKNRKPDWNGIKSNLALLIISGAAIGFNWILLFEAYCYTSVAAATLCYYLAPILVILGAPFVLHEKLTVKKLLCALCALVGMVLVSGVPETRDVGSDGIKGVLFGIAAAVLYASVILVNKKMKPIPALEKTALQLFFSSLALVPYVIAAGNSIAPNLNSTSIILLCIMGIAHTGIAYLLYFGSMSMLRANTVALFSYIDPVLAIVLSAVLLKEPLSVYGMIGALLILGSAFISELGKL